MIRLADSGDWHLPEGPRFGDVKACLDYVVDDGIAQAVELWTIKGDLSGITVPHVATVLERNTLDRMLQRMADHAPVIIVEGNHDAPGDLDGYALLSARHPIFVVTKPAVFDVAGARVFALPYQWKRDWLHLVDGTPEEKDRAIERMIADLIASWIPQREQATAMGMPTIFLGHGTVENAAIAGGEVLPPGHEIALSVWMIEALGCDFASVSHFHLCQQMSPRLWLAGSPSRSNFGEEDVKGYLVVDVDSGRLPQVHRRLTPARQFVTLDATWALDAGAGSPGWIMDAVDSTLEIDGAEVRIRVTVPEEAAATAPVEDLVARIRARGAVDVKPERRTVPKQELRCPAIVEATSLEAQVRAFFSMLPVPPNDAQAARCMAKLAELQRGEQFALEAAA